MNQDLCGTKIIHQERVEKAQKMAIGLEDSEQLASFFKAFSDPKRLRILSALAQQEMCVCDIAAFLQSSPSAVSHQLRCLRMMKLVTNRREGTVLYYQLADEHISKVIQAGFTHIKE